MTEAEAMIDRYGAMLDALGRITASGHVLTIVQSTPAGGYVVTATKAGAIPQSVGNGRISEAVIRLADTVARGAR